MTKGNMYMVKIFRSTRCLPIAVLKLCFVVWTYDVIGSATSTELTAKICKNAVNSSVESICCQSKIEIDKHLETCFDQVNMSFPNVEKDDERIIRISKFTECVYKKRKYIKSDNQLNIGRVKAEANRLYHTDSLMKNYMINMYRYCAQYATIAMQSVGEDPELKEVQCPYFVWKDKKNSEDKVCIELAAECVKGNKE